MTTSKLIVSNARESKLSIKTIKGNHFCRNERTTFLSECSLVLSNLYFHMS